MSVIQKQYNDLVFTGNKVYIDGLKLHNKAISDLFGVNPDQVGLDFIKNILLNNLFKNNSFRYIAPINKHENVKCVSRKDGGIDHNIVLAFANSITDGVCDKFETVTKFNGSKMTILLRSANNGILIYNDCFKKGSISVYAVIFESGFSVPLIVDKINKASKYGAPKKNFWSFVLSLCKNYSFKNINIPEIVSKYEKLKDFKTVNIEDVIKIFDIWYTSDI